MTERVVYCEHIHVRRDIMNHGETKIEAGAVTFALQYRALMPDQGVSIQVLGKVRNKSTELLRFDCFDQRPHYHYDPDGKNERIDLDVTTHGKPLAWTLQQLRTRLAPMLIKAGYEKMPNALTLMMLSKLDEVEAVARQMAHTQRRTVTTTVVTWSSRPATSSLVWNFVSYATIEAWPFTSSVTWPGRKSSCWLLIVSKWRRTTITDRAIRMSASTGIRRWSPTRCNGP